MTADAEIEWRRTWKPDLSSKSWTTMKIGTNTFLVKYLFKDASYELLITDLVSMWYEATAEERIRKQCRKLNPNVDAPISRLLVHIESMLSDQSNVKFDFSTAGQNDDTAVLKSYSQLAGFPFIWTFDATKAESEMMVKHMTVPLLSMVGELLKREKELVKLLSNKDKEIADYKAQGAKTTRKHFETDRFDSINFANEIVASTGFETEVACLGSSTFLNQDGQKLYTDIMTKHAYLVDENNEEISTKDIPGQSLFADFNERIPETAGLPSWGNRLPPSLAKASPSSSPTKSPQKQPNDLLSPESENKETELVRRQALERKLANEETKKSEKSKKKRKLKL